MVNLLRVSTVVQKDMIVRALLYIYCRKAGNFLSTFLYYLFICCYACENVKMLASCVLDMIHVWSVFFSAEVCHSNFQYF